MSRFWPWGAIRCSDIVEVNESDGAFPSNEKEGSDNWRLPFTFLQALAKYENFVQGIFDRKW
jgi:hypothetical protein